MGLLDFTNTPEGMQGLALLAAAGPSMQPMNFASRLAMAGDTYRGLLGDQLKQKLTQAQIDNFSSEAATRKAALDKQQKLLDLFSPTAAPVAAPAMGQLGSGSFGIVPPPAGQPDIPTVQAGAPTSRVGSMTPDQLALGKLLGVDLTDVYKLTRPDIQVSNGYAYDKNKTQPGFLPQLNVANNGQVTQVQIGADGQPFVAAPRGSLEAYRAFRNADEGAKAGSDLVQVYNPQTKRMEFRSRASVLDNQPSVGAPPATAAMPPAQPGMQGNFEGDPRAVMDSIMAMKDPQERANALAGYIEQARRTPGFAQGANLSLSGGAAAGPSAAESAAAASQKEYAGQVAKDVAEQRKAIMQADFAAPANIAKYQRLGQLLQNVDGGKLTPLGTDIASAANSIGLKIDKNLPNKQAAAAMANEIALQLRNPQGGAGMPGALSDRDREFLVSMTPGITQSAEGRKQIIDSYIAIQSRNRQVAQFARNYEKKYGQLDNGFFDQLSAWSSQNPLFGGK